MTRLLMLVEGPSEEIFVKQILTPYLREYGVYVESPIILWTKRISSGGGFRGGVSNWKQIQKNLKPLLQDSDAWVTTLLDFYGLPQDFPGYEDALKPGNPKDKVVTLQKKFIEEMGNPRKFIPFFALHEFEAWLFCSPVTVAQHFGNQNIATSIQSAVTQAGEPELINHGEDTHPKSRLQNLGIGYKETSDGPTIIGKIGIPIRKGACSHFSSWLDRLETLDK